MAPDPVKTVSRYRRPLFVARRSRHSIARQRRRLRRGHIPKSVRRRLEPPISRRVRPHGISDVWLRVRRVIWSPWPWAAAMFFAIGAGREGWAIWMGLAALAMYLTSSPEQAPQFGLEHGIAVDTPAFTDTLTGLTGSPYQSGNALLILNNGDRFYPAMLEAVTDAETSITMEAYIYWEGSIGREFANALAARARQGVQVKLLLDAVGSSTIGRDILRILEDARCHVAWFNPVRWWRMNRVNNRTHRKSLIVDGDLAFTGGAGIADHWLGDADDEAHWRDMMVRIEGPAVGPLQTGFAQNWLETTGEVISGPEFFPPLFPAGDIPIQTVLSSPTTGASAARLTYFFPVACARRSLLIANPYFVPDPVAIELLTDAARRGVRVQVIVSGIHNDNWLARQNSVRLFGRLLRAGVEVFEYNRTMLHHKTMVVDGAWATIGTTNFDNRSFAHNEESNVCFTDPTRVAELEATLQADLAASDPVDLEAWRRRGLVARAEEFVASFLEHQV